MLNRLLDRWRTATTQPEVRALPNFHGQLWTRIHEEFADWMDQPVFAHPSSGEAATSVYALDKLLGLEEGTKWGGFISRLLSEDDGGAMFKRTDLRKKNAGSPTHCILLREAERLIVAARPRKGKAAFARFRRKYGI